MIFTVGNHGESRWKTPHPKRPRTDTYEGTTGGANATDDNHNATFKMHFSGGKDPPPTDQNHLYPKWKKQQWSLGAGAHLK